MELNEISYHKSYIKNNNIDNIDNQAKTIAKI